VTQVPWDCDAIGRSRRQCDFAVTWSLSMWKNRPFSATACAYDTTTIRLGQNYDYLRLWCDNKEQTANQVPAAEPSFFTYWFATTIRLRHCNDYLGLWYERKEQRAVTALCALFGARELGTTLPFLVRRGTRCRWRTGWSPWAGAWSATSWYRDNRARPDFASAGRWSSRRGPGWWHCSTAPACPS